jgi:hypothetical protein
VATASRHHPILDAVVLDGLLVSPVDVERPLDVSAVVASAAGAPVLAAYQDGARRIVELRIDVAESPVTVETAFPLLLANSVEWLAAPRAGATEITAGTGLPADVGARGDVRMAGTFDESGRGALTTPRVSGKATARPAGVPAAPGVRGGVAVAGQEDTGTSEAVPQPDRLDGLGRASPASRLVVNPDTSESDLRAAVAPALTAVPSGTDRPVRASLTGVLLVGALALLAVEWRVRHGHRAAGRVRGSRP